MAYFPNGTEGLYLEQQCCECLHQDDDDTMCPVYLVQMHYNCDQLKPQQKKLRECLNFLIDEHGTCQMKKTLHDRNLLSTGINDTRSELEKWEEERAKR